MYPGRTSHGVRGLKCVTPNFANCKIMSHLAWGAWIEISRNISSISAASSHLAWGAWIEMNNSMFRCHAQFRRTSHGVRGLKYRMLSVSYNAILSHLAWGAWIEICDKVNYDYQRGVAPRMGCVD